MSLKEIKERHAAEWSEAGHACAPHKYAINVPQHLIDRGELLRMVAELQAKLAQLEEDYRLLKALYKQEAHS